MWIELLSSFRPTFKKPSPDRLDLLLYKFKTDLYRFACGHNSFNLRFQVSSASLRIRANIGLSAYLLNNYPVITYAILSGISLIIVLTIFAIYWTSQGIQVYQRIRENQISMQNKEHSS